MRIPSSIFKPAFTTDSARSATLWSKELQDVTIWPVNVDTNFAINVGPDGALIINAIIHPIAAFKYQFVGFSGNLCTF